MSGPVAALALVAGAALLYLGAEWLVRGAVGLGRALEVRPLVLGLTVVAYGTSAPELVVCGAAALEGRSALVLGDVIGANLANLGLVLGVSALLRPPRIEAALARREVPVLLATALCLPVLLADGLVSRVEGGVMLAGAATFTALVTRGLTDGGPAAGAAGTGAEVEAQGGAPAGGGVAWLSLVALVGLALLLVGGKLVVDGAVAGARALGASERVIGLTIVAAGTAAPELGDRDHGVAARSHRDRRGERRRLQRVERAVRARQRRCDPPDRGWGRRAGDRAGGDGRAHRARGLLPARGPKDLARRGRRPPGWLRRVPRLAGRDPVTRSRDRRTSSRSADLANDEGGG